MDPAATWETLNDDTLRLIVSKRRNARFRALLINVCKLWNTVILQNTFEDLEPFLLDLDQRKLVGVLRLAWTRPASIRTLLSIRTALSAAVGNVWTPARPPALADKGTWLANQVFKNDWVEKWVDHCPEDWVPHRLCFTGGKVSIIHDFGQGEMVYPSNPDMRIDNKDWENRQDSLIVNGEPGALPALSPPEECFDDCESDQIWIELNENLAGELQLQLTKYSSCRCGWGEDRIYESPNDEREEIITIYALVDDDENTKRKREGEDREEKRGEEEEGKSTSQ